MKDAKITYKINRVGQVSTNHKSPNQCKSVGHKDFEYHAKVKVGPKLDDQGFVIDHLDIHKAIAATFEKGIASEMMCRDCAKAIVKACKKHGCQVFSVYLKIKPVGKDVMAFMETEIKLKK